MEVVINSCYGGFGLSHRGLKAYCERKGIPCNFFRRDGLRGPYTRIADEEAFADESLFSVSAFRCETPDEIPSQEEFQSMSLEERRASNAHYAQIAAPHCSDIPRDDPDLIAVVREMGDAANGRCASLEIVDVPDGVAWEISEYDGNEHVAEQHRTWR